MNILDILDLAFDLEEVLIGRPYVNIHIPEQICVPVFLITV